MQEIDQGKCRWGEKRRERKEVRRTGKDEGEVKRGPGWAAWGCSTEPLSSRRPSEEGIPHLAETPVLAALSHSCVGQEQPVGSVDSCKCCGAFHLSPCSLQQKIWVVVHFRGHHSSHLVFLKSKRESLLNFLERSWALKWAIIHTGKDQEVKNQCRDPLPSSPREAFHHCICWGFYARFLLGANDPTAS